MDILPDFFFFFCFLSNLFVFSFLNSQLFIWQAHNALFMIRCLLKVFIWQMGEEELHQQFTYQERAPGSCEGELFLYGAREKKTETHLNIFTQTYCHYYLDVVKELHVTLHRIPSICLETLLVSKKYLRPIGALVRCESLSCSHQGQMCNT